MVRAYSEDGNPRRLSTQFTVPPNWTETAPQALFALHFYEFAYRTFFRPPSLRNY